MSSPSAREAEILADLAAIRARMESSDPTVVWELELTLPKRLARPFCAAVDALCDRHNLGLDLEINGRRVWRRQAVIRGPQSRMDAAEPEFAALVSAYGLPLTFC